MALAWWALRFSPRVAVLEEAVLLEAQASCRLFGGQKALVRKLEQELPAAGGSGLAIASTALAALALLRTLDALNEDAQAALPLMICNTRQLPARLDALPYEHLSATHAHTGMLARLGCRTLGDVRALPRGGVSRRFGADLLEALDHAYGLRPETFAWIELPEVFRARLEFMGCIEIAEGMLFGARRLLGQLASWLLARQRGALAVTLSWEHDLVRRGELQNGQLQVRTAEATRDVGHLARLLSEHLARLILPAPVQAIRLEATHTEAMASSSASLLPDAVREGETSQQLIERLSVRLGAGHVLRASLQADHRPQHMQTWRPAGEKQLPGAVRPLPHHLQLQPGWLLREPLRLLMQGDRPLYQGPLLMLAGPERLESGWWSLLSAAETEGDELALRDYFVARSPKAGLLWVYRRRSAGEPAWFLQGIYG